MNKHTKFNLRSMIIVILALAACSASPSLATATNPEPTLPEVNPFDPTPTSQTQPGAEQPNAGMSIGGYKGGCDVHYPDYTFTYDGNPIQIPCQFEGTGFDTEVGLMFFLDGFPQPHQITETDKSDPSTETGQEVFMSKHRFSKDGSISFTVSITPVTGKAGDELSLFMTRVWEPSFLPEDESGNLGYKINPSFDLPMTILMKADAPQQAEDFAFEVETEQIPQSETKRNQDDLNPSGRIRQICFSLYTDEFTYSINKMYADNGSIDLKLGGYGGMETDYRVTVFVNHQPFSIGGHESSLMSLYYDKISEVAITLDIHDYGRLNILYAMVIPVGQTYKDPEMHPWMTFPVMLFNNPAVQVTPTTP
jgi:hypothetical protein